MLGTARATQYGYSLYDFNVYGTGTTAGVTPLDRSAWTASASSTEGGGSAATAIDGTDWSSQTAMAGGTETGPLTDIQLSGPVEHRYIRIVQTGSASYWWSIGEFNVYV